MRMAATEGEMVIQSRNFDDIEITTTTTTATIGIPFGSFEQQNANTGCDFQFRPTTIHHHKQIQDCQLFVSGLGN